MSSPETSGSPLTTPGAGYSSPQATGFSGIKTFYGHHLSGRLLPPAMYKGRSSTLELDRKNDHSSPFTMLLTLVIFSFLALQLPEVFGKSSLLCLTVCLCISLLLCRSVSFCLSVCLSFCLCISLLLCLSVSFCLSFCPSFLRKLPKLCSIIIIVNF